MPKKNISPQQKSILIDLMDQNPQMVTYKQTNQFTNADVSALWQKLTITLNSIPGAEKTWKEWRKTWSDIKSRTKKKVHESRKQAEKTGGGPCMSEKVDEEDDKILGIIGGDLVINGLDVPEAGISIIESVQDLLGIINNTSLQGKTHQIEERENFYVGRSDTVEILQDQKLQNEKIETREITAEIETQPTAE